MDFPFWLVTATHCQNCGGDQVAKVFQLRPTKEEITKVGTGASCETFVITEIKNDQERFDGDEA